MGVNAGKYFKAKVSLLMIELTFIGPFQISEYHYETDEVANSDAVLWHLPEWLRSFCRVEWLEVKDV